MKLWHKLRRGAYFVDLVLLIAALFAIIGLATFVRLHTTKAPDEAGKQGAMALNTSYIDTLSLDNGDSAIPTTSSSDANTNTPATGPENSSVSSQLQSAMTAPEASSPASACGKSCDNTKLTIPETKTEPLPPITVQPIKITPSNCGGLVGRVVNTVLNSRPECLNN
jgi:hypothetical protein